MLRDIGRLRAVTFRTMGEETRQAVALDRFDAHSLPFFVWHKTASEVVDASRRGRTA